MNRQEFLINLTLLTLIGALVYLIVWGDVNNDDLVEPVRVARATEAETEEGGLTETPYVRERDIYKSFGNKPLFQPLITPTPTPPPPTPTPTPTPDINAATANFRASMIMDGIVMLELRKPDPAFPNNMVEMKVGDSVAVDVGRGEKKTLTLKSIDEKTDPYNPAATFTLEGTDQLKVFRMFEDMAPPPQ